MSSLLASPNCVIVPITNLEILIALIKQSISSMVSWNELCHTCFNAIDVTNGKIVNPLTTDDVVRFWPQVISWYNPF